MNESTVFSANRYERDGTHLYYLPKDVFLRLEGQKPVYLVGTRGTGKTTFLKSLNWRERLTNKSLQNALDGDLFGKKYIGVYMRLAKELPNYFCKWLVESQSIADNLFSLYIDYIWTEAVADAISMLIAKPPSMSKKLFCFDPSKETECIEKLFLDYPQLKPSQLRKSDYTFANLAKAIHTSRKQLETDALLRTDNKTLLERYPLNQFGSFGSTVGIRLAEFCTQANSSNEPWHFKICIDETEWFTNEQIKVLNTVVRLSEKPCIFVVSFLRNRFGEVDISSTVKPGVTLSHDDRAVIDLDDKFRLNRDFYEGVATIRVQTVLKSKRCKFKLRKILGELNINKLLKQILSESKSDKATIWLSEARKLAKTPFWKSKFKQTSDEDDEVCCEETMERSPPIYQAYQIARMGLLIPGPKHPDWPKRGQRKAEIRKRMVASYLCMCKELKRSDVLYAFNRMVLQMSDGCIRTFLQLMHELYNEAAKPLRRFLRETMPVRSQHVAILRASTNKRQRISTSRVRYPTEVEKLIECLGQITRYLQSDGPGDSALRSHERGLFVLPEKSPQNHDTYIYDAIDNGYLRLEESKDSSLKFRVHCSLAAYFKFSYRGAYTTTTGLRWSDIDQIIKCKNNKTSLEDIAREIATRLASEDDPRQLQLFNV